MVRLSSASCASSSGSSDSSLVLLVVIVEQPGVVEDHELAHDAFHRHHLLHQEARAARRLRRLVDGELALLGDALHRDRGVDERDHERQRHDGEADEQQLQERPGVVDVREIHRSARL
jgi:hypothetical protein